MNAPAPGELEWRVVQRFRNVSDLQAWRASELHGRLFREASELVEGGDGSGLREDEISDGVANGVVTEVVTTYVKPGKDQEYQAWAEKIHQAEAQFPGYRGAYLQPPPPSASTIGQRWCVLRPPNSSTSGSVRTCAKRYSASTKNLSSRGSIIAYQARFPDGFRLTLRLANRPESWKQSMLVILMLFPIVMLEIRFLSPLLRGLSTSPATFIGNVISVVLLAWPFMPLAIARNEMVAVTRKDSSKWTNALGIALLVGPLCSGDNCAVVACVSCGATKQLNIIGPC